MKIDRNRITLKLDSEFNGRQGLGTMIYYNVFIDGRIAEKMNTMPMIRKRYSMEGKRYMYHYGNKKYRDRKTVKEVIINDIAYGVIT